MRLPPLLRTTPFRLTLVFLALFAGVAAAFLGYIYVATAGEVTRRAEADVTREIASLETARRQGGPTALNLALIDRTAGERPFFYLYMEPDGRTITGNLAASPLDRPAASDGSASFAVRSIDPDGAVVRRSAWGRQVRLGDGRLLFVGSDIGQGRAYVVRIVRALWGAGVLTVLFGLAGGVLVSRNVGRSMAGLRGAIGKVQGGALQARALVRGVRDEFDELATGLNAMLDRVERLMGGLRHAGDAIAHDLRSPLTRLRARMEVAVIEAEAGRGDPVAALHTALEDADGVLRTFNAVLAISRLQAAGQLPSPEVFDLSELAAGVGELYEALCEDKGLEFGAELAPRLLIRGDREFMAQALANLLDNAVKYTPAGGAVMLRTRRRSSGEVEASVTDTGLGVPEPDRPRVLERFVRLENSRHQPGAGLGLSLVGAVVDAHGGRLDLDDGPGVVPGAVEGHGPGLRVAISLPAAA